MFIVTLYIKIYFKMFNFFKLLLEIQHTYSISRMHKYISIKRAKGTYKWLRITYTYTRNVIFTFILMIQKHGQQQPHPPPET